MFVDGEKSKTVTTIGVEGGPVVEEVETVVKVGVKIAGSGFCTSCREMVLSVAALVATISMGNSEQASILEMVLC